MAGVVGICRCLNVSKTIFCKPVYSRGVHMCVVNCVQLFVTPWTVACQDPLSMKISRQEYWSGLSFSSPGDHPDTGIEPRSLVSSALAGRFFTTAPPGKPRAKSLQSCPTLCDPMDCSLPGFSVHGILQAGALEKVAMPSFRASSQPRGWNWVPYVLHWQAGSLPLVPCGKARIAFKLVSISINL